MYLAAGQIVQRLTGKSWDEFLGERIFAPLNMNLTNTSINKLPAIKNVAMPHARIDDQVQKIAYRNIDNIAPAGSINSNVVEMAQWVRLHLGTGKYEGKQVIDSLAVVEMHTPQTIVQKAPALALFFPDAQFLTYGLGWFLHDYRGKKVVEHGGAIDGMRALVAMIPDEQLGVVVLTNLSGNYLPEAMKHRVFDAYLGAPERDWSAELLKTSQGFAKRQNERQKKTEESRLTGTKPSLAQESYAGNYESEMYGKSSVLLENDKLVLTFGPSFIGDLEHWHYDTFRVTWRDKVLGKSFVSFTLSGNGKIDQMKLENLGDFKRASDPEAQTSN